MNDAPEEGVPPPPPPAPIGPPPPPAPVAPPANFSVRNLGGGGIGAAARSLQEQLQGTGLSSWRASTFAPKSTTGLVGLCNQGATCYMNSLLQTLFMTPEFRRGLYLWSYNPEIDGEEATCIPLQLQRLFARLCMSECAYIETKNLTDSFGWHGREVFEQQDVQELCRVLFEAIDKAFFAVGMESPITPLYRGTLHDYLRCTVCGYARIHADQFLDVQLVIRDMSSLEEALDAYVTPELLEKGNQWECSRCQTKVDALKGLKFKELPQILALQLKRFDYNYSTMTRIKLNNRVTFPFFLNLNKYLKGELGDTIGGGGYKKSEEGSAVSSSPASSSSSSSSSGDDDLWACALCTYLNVPARRSCEMCATPRPQIEEAAPPKDVPGYAGDAVSSGGAPPPPPNPFGRVLAEIKDKAGEKDNNDKEKKEEKDNNTDKDAVKFNSHSFWKTPVMSVSDKELEEYEVESEIKEERPTEIGPNDYVYELFSVLVHSGSAMGGHYYAYIKSMETDEWYNFNDMNVSKITENEVRRMYGDSEKQRSANNAYLLMYRRMPATDSAEKEDNKTVVSIPEELMAMAREIPESVRKEIEEENEKYLEEKRVHQEKLDTLTLRIFYGNEPVTVNIHKAKTMQDATVAAHTAAKAQLPLSCVRLREFNTLTGTVGKSYTGREDMTLTALNVFNQKAFLLETKKEDEEWPTEESGGMVVRVIRMNVDTLEFEPAVPIKLEDIRATLGDLRKEIEAKTGMPVSNQRVVKVRQLDAPVEFLEGEDKLLHKDLGVTDGSVVYLEPNEKEWSFVQHRFDTERNTITIDFNKPGDSNFDLSVSIDRRLTIGELKKRIAELVDVPAEEIRLKRKVLSKEYKDDNATLQDCSLLEGSAVMVERGKPLRVGQFTCKIFQFDPTIEDEPFLTLLVEQVLNENDTADAIRQLVKDKIEVPLNRMRVREKNGTRASTVLRDGKTIKASLPVVRDGIEFAVQVVSENEPCSIGEHDMLLEIQQFHPSTMSLGVKQEIPIEKDSSVLALRMLLASKYELPLEFVAVSKPFRFQMTDANAMSTLNWDVDDTRILTASPLYLKDGDFMVFRDCREQSKDLPLSGVAKRVGPKETGVVIRTVYDAPKKEDKEKKEEEQGQQKESTSEGEP